MMTDTGLDIAKMLPIIAPIIVIQMILMVTALVMCIKAEQTRGPKLMWVFIICLVNLIGPILFFIIGRRND